MGFEEWVEVHLTESHGPSMLLTCIVYFQANRPVMPPTRAPPRETSSEVNINIDVLAPPALTRYYRSLLSDGQPLIDQEG